MLKTISAALLATSVIAAPALAAEAGKATTAAPVIKADQSRTKAATTASKPEAGIKADAKRFRRYGSARKLYNFHTDHADAY